MFNQSYDIENVDVKRINNLLRHHTGGRLHNPSNLPDIAVNQVQPMVNSTSLKELFISGGVLVLVYFLIKSLFGR